MKLQIMSDLHLEMHKDGGRQFLKDLEPLAEILILAGDITQVRFLDEADKLFRSFLEKFKTVIFVPGNHEYYRSSPKSVSNLLTTLYHQSGGDLVVLDPGYWMAHKITIVGATLWFPFEKNNGLYAEDLNDFHLIEDFVPWVYEKNKSDIQFLEEHVHEGDVVITHHLPTWESVSMRYRTSQLNRFFLCDVSELILRKKPKLWIHGHTHDACDYMYGETRVICNPLGYPHEGNVLKFNSELVVDV